MSFDLSLSTTGSVYIRPGNGISGASVLSLPSRHVSPGIIANSYSRAAASETEISLVVLRRERANIHASSRRPITHSLVERGGRVLIS